MLETKAIFRKIQREIEHRETRDKTSRLEIVELTILEGSFVQRKIIGL